jgi:hypothetical protein
MAITKPLDLTDPADGDQLRDGASEIRDVKSIIYEHLDNGGHYAQTGTSAVTANGRHQTISDGTFKIYKREGTATAPTTALMTIYDSSYATSSDQNVFDISTLSLRDSSSKTDPGHKHERVMTVNLNGTSGRQSGLVFVNTTSRTITLTGVKLVAYTPPTSTALQVDMLRITSASFTNPSLAEGGTSCVSVFSAGSISLATGSYVGTELTAFSASTLSTGDAWVWHIDALNNAGDISVIIRAAM